MARLEYFIVCRSISTDIDSDELTLSQVVEDLFPEQFLDRLPKVMAVSSWDLADDVLDKDFQALLKVVLPGDEEKGPSFAMNLHRGRRRYRAMQGVLEIPLLRPGDLRVEVHLNGEYAARHIVTVHPPGVRAADGSGAKID